MTKEVDDACDIAGQKALQTRWSIHDSFILWLLILMPLAVWFASSDTHYVNGSCATLPHAESPSEGRRGRHA